ncbi:metal ABC transporter solute-binding protein, Zn/Mn family [Natrialbaceae archaeon A-arb3/5]
MEYTRRSILQASGGALAGSVLAGCLSEPGGSDDGESSGYAAFFTLWDWTNQIGGDELSFENPVDVGEMGHGWEPPADTRRDIVASDIFVYLDTDEFSWAQNVAADLETDYDDVTVIDGMAGLENQLLPIDREADDDREPATDHEFDPETVSIGAFDLYDRQSGEETAYWHDDADHWHGGIPEVPTDGYITVEGVFEDDEGRVLPLDGEPFVLDASLADGANEGVVDIVSQGDHVEFHGLEEGRTRILFELVADGEVVWDTSSDLMTVDIVADIADDAAPEFYDPHVWADPILAQNIVETIADGLADADPDNSDYYHDNAAAYIERLDEVDQQFADLASNATRDTAVFAGHDSFQYLEQRYGFELHTPVGVAPDAAEVESDISESIDIVEEHDIDTILYDPFETTGSEDVPEMVELLLENTDATNYEPLSAGEGTTAEWNDRGWGWVEQMEELNIPSLRTALGAE